MSRGKKICKNCGISCGPRSLACPKCGIKFIFKDKSPAQILDKIMGNIPSKTLCDYKTLERGDRIKVIQGSGPYFKSKETGENIPMGYTGKFKVLYVDKNYIHATGNKKEGVNARCLIYVGPPQQSQYGVWKEPHKVVKLKRKVG